MSDVFISPGSPPSWVPGPFNPPPVPSRYSRPVTQPQWRVIDVPVVSTLAEIAMRYYRDPQAFMRIFNDNRQGMRMPDGSEGALGSPNDTVMPGTRIWLS